MNVGTLTVPPPNKVATVDLSDQVDALFAAQKTKTRPEDDYRIETVQLNSSGFALVYSRTVPGSVAIANLGSTTIVAQADHIAPSPTGLSGPQSVQIGSGYMVTGMLPSRILSFYGRAGEYLVVQRYRDMRSGSGPISPERWFTVAGLGGASAVVYTTPWGLPVEYGGFSARETTEVAGNRVLFRFRDGSATGRIMETVSLGPGESTSDHDIHSLLLADSLYLEMLGGGGTGEIAVRVR